MKKQVFLVFKAPLKNIVKKQKTKIIGSFEIK